MPHELSKIYEPGAIEARWAEYWVRERLFHVETPANPAAEGGVGRAGTPVAPLARPVFALLLPPPNVTGRLHMGHMLNQTQMDMLVRWHRMRGFITLWLPGTDHAGIATQMMVERQLAKEGKNRREMGREKFVERVWEWKREYGGAILDQMKRLGASVDWGREYFTMDENLSRAVREVFVRLYEEELIYRGKYIVNWCPRCETAISDLEVKHEEVAGKIWEIRYPVAGTGSADAASGGTGEDARRSTDNLFVTVATTRPETMLGDVAVAVNAADERYTHLHGRSVRLPLMGREIPIILDEIARPEFGTGAVKITPAHDANDFEAGKRHGLTPIDVMDLHARMNENAGPYKGLDRYAAREAVLGDLREQGFLVAEKDYMLSLGKCDRCGTVVEPRLSEQWFVKIAPLAKKAIAAVETGEITITPENYKQIYLNWMNNIHDWTISRQLWWGHRIPVWHCGDCDEVIVARETPVACTKCGSGRLEQDTDVLDTWFSSGLLPFTTLGWPAKTRDQEVFYPTTLLITAYEILFFWVARMIMFGCHFMAGHEQDAAIKQASGWADKKDDSVPFRNVYIHALVRDAERQKMSKTKGNVVDPIEVIAQYGTDATRFTLASMAAPGTDIAFSESRTAGYRNFANKIWNAARFMFMNVERIEAGLRPSKAGVAAGLRPAPDAAEPRHHTGQIDQQAGVTGFSTSTLEDRWILSRFNRAARDVNESLRIYRFDEAANRIYDFFWGDLCDWYIELIKPRLNSGVEGGLRPLDGAEPRHHTGSDHHTSGGHHTDAARVACFNLVNLFDSALRLLHPVMPFITEEIWQAMYDGAPPLKSIALAAYPAADEGQIDLGAETEMAILQDLIVSVRNLRAELKVEPKVKVPVDVFAHEPEIRAMLEKNLGAVLQDRPANVEKVAFVEESLAKVAGARSTSRFDVRLVYEKQIDVAAERSRLTKELEKTDKQLTTAQARLGDEQFLQKAPAHVVEGLRKQVEELTVMREKILAQLKELG